jgi:hypothetical protein
MAMFAPMPLAAGSIMSQIERRRRGDADSAGVAKVLEDMSENLGDAECYLLLFAVAAACALSCAVVFTLLLFLAPPHQVHWSWRWVSFVCWVTSAVFVVLIIEPRPMHWLPSFDGVLRSMRACSLSEMKARYRRWYRWRTQYAAKTKLNV